MNWRCIKCGFDLLLNAEVAELRCPRCGGEMLSEEVTPLLPLSGIFLSCGGVCGWLLSTYGAGRFFAQPSSVVWGVCGLAGGGFLSYLLGLAIKKK
jgi:DNA-directed RNA polymerase subunit RPC12/RpoP